MKELLLNTFYPLLTIMITCVLISGSLSWANISSKKPFLVTKPLFKSNKFL